MVARCIYVIAVKHIEMDGRIYYYELIKIDCK